MGLRAFERCVNTSQVFVCVLGTVVLTTSWLTSCSNGGSYKLEWDIMQFANFKDGQLGDWLEYESMWALKHRNIS